MDVSMHVINTKSFSFIKNPNELTGRLEVLRVLRYISDTKTIHSLQMVISAECNLFGTENSKQKPMIRMNYEFIRYENFCGTPFATLSATS